MANRFNLSSSFVKMHKNVHTFLNPEVKMIVVSISNLGILLIDYVILNWSSNIRCGGRLKSACCFNLFSFIMTWHQKNFPICLWIQHTKRSKSFFFLPFLCLDIILHIRNRDECTAVQQNMQRKEENQARVAMPFCNLSLCATAHNTVHNSQIGH